MKVINPNLVNLFQELISKYTVSHCVALTGRKPWLVGIITDPSVTNSTIFTIEVLDKVLVELELSTGIATITKLDNQWLTSRKTKEYFNLISSSLAGQVKDLAG